MKFNRILPALALLSGLAAPAFAQTPAAPAAPAQAQSAPVDPAIRAEAERLASEGVGARRSIWLRLLA